jgi:hypothetical protein
MSEKETSPKISWDNLTEEQKRILIDGLVKSYVDCHRALHRKFMNQLYDDLFTPFWVRWARSLKRKLFKK